MDSNIELIVINSDTKDKETINAETRLKLITDHIISLFTFQMNNSDKGELKDLYKEFDIYSSVPNIISPGNKSQDIDIICNVLEKISMKTKKRVDEIHYCPFETNHYLHNNRHAFKLDYNFVFVFNLIIIQILEKMTNEEMINKIKDIQRKYLSFTNDTSNWIGKKSNLAYLKDIFQCSTIEIAFSESNPDQSSNHNKKVYNELFNNKIFLSLSLLFFFLFFPHVFSNIEQATIDMNIYQLITSYSKIANPNKFIFLTTGSEYHMILLANYFSALQLKKMERLTILTIKANESYIIENQELKQKKDSLCFLELIQLNKLDQLSLEINCLDALVFKHSIDLILGNKTLEKLTIDLFSNEPFYFRKLYYNAGYLNNTAYNILDSEKAEDQYIDYRYIDNLSEGNNRIISKDKVVKYLFKGFNDNMRNLILIIETLLRSLKCLDISLKAYPEIIDYDSYTSSLTCFLFDLMLILNEKINSKIIEEIKIVFNVDNYHFLMNNLMKEYNLEEKKFSLQFPLVKTIDLNIPNLGTFISFDELPYDRLQTLIFHKLSIEDFIILVLAMKKSILTMVNLSRIEIELEYSDTNSTESLCDFLKECLPSQLTYCLLNIPNEIQLSTLVKMINSLMIYMKNNHDENTEKTVIDIYCNFQEIKLCEGDHKKMCKKGLPQIRKVLRQHNIFSYRCVVPIKTYLQFSLYSLIKNKLDYTVLYSLEHLFKEKRSLTLPIKERIFSNVFQYLHARQLQLNIHPNK